MNWNPGEGALTPMARFTTAIKAFEEFEPHGNQGANALPLG